MPIASQFPVVSQAQSSSMLRTLALVPGQTLEARVLGPGPDGTTMVQVGRNALSLSLPNAPQVGAALTLAVQQADGQLRLVLVQSQFVSTPPGPATSVEISGQGASQQAPLTYGPGGTPSLGGSAGSVAGVAIAGSIAAAPTSAGILGAPAPPGVQPIAPATAAAPGTGQAAPRPASMPYGPTSAGVSALQGPPLPTPAPALPTTHLAALGQMLQQSLPAQTSLGALTSVLSATIGQLAVPEPVLKAARQILDNQLVSRDGKIDAATLKAAVRGSGIFQEAMLAKGMPTEAGADTKSGLLALRQSLTQWLGNQAPIAQVSQLPPPLRHVNPRARQPELLLPLLPTEPEDLGKLLLERAEGALSRLRLHQHASLPEANRAGDSQWSMDLPILYGGQQAIMHLQIHQDAAGDSVRPGDRGWQVRFALNLPFLGEVGAQISLRGAHTGIMLWADREETAARFSEEIAELKLALETAGLRPGALVVRHGAPTDLHAPAGSGQYLDAVR